MKLEKYVGQDRIVGRPIKLNRFELEINKQGYAPLLFFGDLHFGSAQCDLKRAEEMLDWALREKVPMLGMGDMVEMATRTSVGQGVYEQKLQPQEQIEGVVDLLMPMAEAGLIKGYHDGNHSKRVSIATGIDISKVIARLLKVPYLGYSCWNLAKVGKQNYKIYSTHGSSGATMGYTKLNAGIKLSYFLNADVIAYAHTHELSTATRIIQDIDLRSKTVIERKQYIVMTGSYLKWGGYAQDKGLPIAKLGSPKAKFLATSHDAHISL